METTTDTVEIEVVEEKSLGREIMEEAVKTVATLAITYGTIYLGGLAISKVRERRAAKKAAESTEQ